MASTSGLKRPELKLTGNMSENFKNFEMRFNDFCIQAKYRDTDKNPETEKDGYYKEKQLEISALRSAMPDEALQIIRYTVEPQIPTADKNKPWVWMEKLKTHYTGSIGSSLMTDRFRFWQSVQSTSESVQDWEVKVRQSGSLCEYEAVTDEMNRDKFVFGLHDTSIRTELLKTHLKADKTKKTLSDVVAEAKTLESAQKANQIIADANRNVDEQVHYTNYHYETYRKPHKDMKLKREKGTCFWCGKRGQHPWKDCSANGKVCDRCGMYDHLSRVCLEEPLTSERPSRGQGLNQRGRGGRGRGGRGNFGNRGRRDGNFSPRGRGNRRGGSRGRGAGFNQDEIHYTEENPESEYYTDNYDPAEYETYAVYSLEECNAETETANETDTEPAVL